MSASKGRRKLGRLRLKRGPLLAALAGICVIGIVVTVRYALYAPGAGPYMPSIIHWSKEYGLDPLLGAAVLEAESSGRSRAVSSAGALGLMQLMPPTAKQIASELDRHEPSRLELFDPETNIRYGIYYLAKLRRRFGDRHELVIAAYHAGPTRVARWVDAHPELSPDQIISRRAASSTRAYVRRVMSLWERNRRDSGPS